MPFSPSATSLKFLDGVDPRMKQVVLLAFKKSKIDFKVICGRRTLAEQKALYAQGRTKPGKIVTWTLNSRHLPDPKTGLSKAVDLLPAPYDWKLVDNKATPEVDDAFKLVADAMMEASRELNIPIRWGANWDGDKIIREKGETDNPHFELVG